MAYRTCPFCKTEDMARLRCFVVYPGMTKINVTCMVCLAEGPPVWYADNDGTGMPLAEKKAQELWGLEE